MPWKSRKLRALCLQRILPLESRCRLRSSALTAFSSSVGTATDLIMSFAAETARFRQVCPAIGATGRSCRGRLRLRLSFPGRKACRPCLVDYALDIPLFPVICRSRARLSADVFQHIVQPFPGITPQHSFIYGHRPGSSCLRIRKETVRDCLQPSCAWHPPGFAFKVRQAWGFVQRGCLHDILFRARGARGKAQRISPWGTAPGFCMGRGFFAACSPEEARPWDGGPSEELRIVAVRCPVIKCC